MICDAGVHIGSLERVNVLTMVECINVDHHGVGAMESGPCVCWKFLGPAVELVAWSIV